MGKATKSGLCSISSLTKNFAVSTNVPRNHDLGFSSIYAAIASPSPNGTYLMFFRTIARTIECSSQVKSEFTVDRLALKTSK